MLLKKDISDFNYALYLMIKYCLLHKTIQKKQNIYSYIYTCVGNILFCCIYMVIIRFIYEYINQQPNLIIISITFIASFVIIPIWTYNRVIKSSEELVSENNFLENRNYDK